MRRLAAVAVLLAALGAGNAQGQAAPPKLTQSQVFRWSELPSRRMSNGGESRDSLRGVLATGEAVTVHESVMPAGMKPNPQHVIQHSEIVTVIEGTIAFEHGDVVEKVEPGGIIYVAPGTLHTLHNVGEGPCRYVVIALGGDVKK